MSEEGRFTIRMEHLQDYEFKVKFDWEKAAEVLMDEPPPLGGKAGPNAARMLAAAAANCLSASLLYCVSKEDVPTGSVQTEATVSLVRNEQKRLRIGEMAVRLQVNGELTESVRMKRCMDLFEDFCVVSASIRAGIPIAVEVVDAAGAVLHRAE
ncbi:MAG: OsmC family protein [Gammaproteobacteria bacterium]|nr:OsmC family protein [Gammaproteobacteria bacterium]